MNGGPEAPLARRRHRPLVAVGFVLAVVAMVLGLVVALAPLAIGLVLLRSGRRRAGVALLATTLVLVLVPRVVVWFVLDGRTYRVPSGAMEPTVKIGDRVLAFGDDTPERGDLFVFTPPAGAASSIGGQCGVPQPAHAPCPQPTPEPQPGTTFLKRVVGLPGDRLKIVHNRAYVNGRRLDEPYVKTSPCVPPVCNMRREITIPPDHYFVLGDNRGQSNDSRDWGPVPGDWMLRRVVLRYWPLGRFGSL